MPFYRRPRAPRWLRWATLAYVFLACLLLGFIVQYVVARW